MVVGTRSNSIPGEAVDELCLPRNVITGLEEAMREVPIEGEVHSPGFRQVVASPPVFRILW